MNGNGSSKENGAQGGNQSGIAKRTWDWMRGKKATQSQALSTSANVQASRMKSKSADVSKVESESEKENTSPAHEQNRPSSPFTPLSWDNNGASGQSNWERVRAPTHSDDTLKKSDSTEKDIKRRSLRLSSQPKGTLVYTVSGNESLASIAARFDTTLSEVKKLNKLMGTAVVFPGQIIYVPDKDYVPSPPPSPVVDNNSPSPPPSLSPRSNPSSPTTEFPRPAPGLAKPVTEGGGMDSNGHQAGAGGGLGMRPTPEERRSAMENALTVRFVKVSCKHITDGQGVVSGVLLVTPNAVMFDPNVSDSLVLEHGPETYGLIAPMDTILSVAMYHDIAAMRLKSHPQDALPSVSKIYHKDDCPMATEKSSLATEHSNTPPDLIKDIPDASTNERTRTESSCSCGHDVTEKPQQLLENSKLPNSNNSQRDSKDSNKSDKDKGKTESKNIDNFKSSDNQSSKLQADDVLETSKTVTSSVTSSGVKPTGEKVTKSQVHSSQVDNKNLTKTMPFNSSLDKKRSKELNSNPPIVSEPEADKLSAEKVEFSLSHDDDEQPAGTNEKASSAEAQLHTASRKRDGKARSVSESADGTPLITALSQAQTSPEKGILTRTLGSLSSMTSLSSTPGLSSLVDYSSGLFTRKDSKVKDIHDMAPASTEDFRTSSSSSIFYVNMENNSSEAVDKVHVESAVSLEDRPELFQSLDALIPRPAAQYEDPPLYLCLKLRSPKAVKKTTSPIESYVKKSFRPEYWFSIPKDKVDELYAFFLQWSPSLYGNEEEVDFEGQGFVVVDKETIDIVDDHFDPSRRLSQSWKMVHPEEMEREELPQIEDIVVLPELLEASQILTNDHIHKLGENLPARAEGYAWALQYSSAQHGISLKTLYRKMKGVDSPVLLVVKDTDDQVFGAMLSCGPVMSDHFIGTGETYLFTFYPEFKIFRWTGANTFYMKGNQESLAIGASEGVYGLWLDSDLYHGRSHYCSTFENDVLTKSEDFVISRIEAWVFV